MCIVVLILLTLKAITTTFGDECVSRDFGNGGTVCVCNAIQCHTIEPVVPVKSPQLLKYTSNMAGLRLTKTQEEFGTSESSSKNLIVIGNTEYQTVHGFGGAFTDSTGINILSLSNATQEKLLRSYFAKDGIEYSLGRVPIGGTDFSTRGYSYHDNIEDGELKNFSLQYEDYHYKIPIIQRALLLNPALKFFSSAWIAPKWMKTNGAYSGFGGALIEKYYQSWANYFLKFLDEYKNNKILFWGITTGNEPFTAYTTSLVPSVAWTASTQGTWIANKLGPTIRKSQHSNIKILALDDQRLYLPWFIKKLFNNPKVEEYIDGIGVHWYMDAISPLSNLDLVHNTYPDKFILATEACEGSILPFGHVLLGSWLRGENYANSIIEDISHWTTGWMDWNMALNLDGGPTYIKNFVDSPIIVNAEQDEFYKQPMYYALGHFSKFIPRDSVRIGSTGFDNYVPVVAFKRPDNATVVVILNKSTMDKRATLVNQSRGKIDLKLTKKSITTIIYW